MQGKGNPGRIARNGNTEREAPWRLEPVPDPAKEQEYREEAARLAQLPRDQQKAILAMHRTDAANRRVPKADREYAKERVEALERHLRRLNRKQKNL
jgi:hypothetical protein